MFIYSLGIRLYGFIVSIVAYFNPKAKKWVEGRKHFFHNLPDCGNKKVVWFHCASLGEFEQGRPIMEQWKKDFPQDFILVTFFSPSGYEIQKNYPVADHCCYLPLDTKHNARNFIKHFQPKIVFFVKYEFWLNYIDEAKKNNALLFSLSANFRSNQRFFRWYGGIFRKALRQFDYFFVQTVQSKDLLQSIAIEHVLVSGDTRYDRVIDRVQQQKENHLIAAWLGEEKAFVVGSSWPEDEQFLLPIINEKQWKKKVIIAPHNVDEKHIQSLLQQIDKLTKRYTSITPASAIPPNVEVLVLDCIGVLADAYKYGDFAYVGGAFGSGLHNILEPAAFGLPVIFGPKFTKFPEAAEFILEGIGFSFQTKAELHEKIAFIQNNTLSLNQQVSAFTLSKKGAREKVFNLLKSKWVW